MIQPRKDREALLHRWVADGQVETHTRVIKYDDIVTEYRVPGTKEWWRNDPAPEGFPSIKLIATLALGVMTLQPTLKPITPQWQHAWRLPMRRFWET